MEFKYCPLCGKELVKKNIGDEGLIPFCNDCESPFFDWIPTCIISVVTNEKDEVLLLRQNYVSKVNWGHVAGYMSKGESAEECAVREILEETAQAVDEIKYLKSYYYEKKNLLMLGFHGKVTSSELITSSEVDSLQWFDYQKALDLIRPESIAHKILLEYYNLCVK